MTINYALIYHLCESSYHLPFYRIVYVTYSLTASLALAFCHEVYSGHVLDMTNVHRMWIRIRFRYDHTHDELDYIWTRNIDSHVWNVYTNDVCYMWSVTREISARHYMVRQLIFWDIVCQLKGWAHNKKKLQVSEICRLLRISPACAVHLDFSVITGNN